MASALLGAARAQDVESPLVAQSAGEALRDGRLLLGLRPRYTWVEQDGRAQSAHWGSLRTTLGWQTLTLYGLRVTAEAIDVRHIDPQGAIDYTETPAYTGRVPGGPLYGPYTPGYYPLVVDPNTTDANRLFVDYTRCRRPWCASAGSSSASTISASSGLTTLRSCRRRSTGCSWKAPRCAQRG
jgi:hypothetical protein